MKPFPAGGILIGVDGGGTYSRALCTDVSGNVLAYVEGLPTNPDYNADAHVNFRWVVADVLEKARRAPEDIVGFVAGLAGLDAPDDDDWARNMTSIPGMPCVPHYVNDAYVALAGAVGLRPGILVIAATGSITVGINEQGEKIRNYDFNHYAKASARFLSHEAIYQLLTRELAPLDQPFLSAVLDYWEVKSLADLRDIARQYTSLDRETMIRRYGRMCPLLTEAAEQEGPLARRVCDWGVNMIVDGICLVHTCFGDSDGSQRDSISTQISDRTPVAITGGVARSAYMYRRLQERLAERLGHRCVVVEPMLSPVCGAILLAAHHLGIEPLHDVQLKLSESQLTPAA